MIDMVLKMMGSVSWSFYTNMSLANMSLVKMETRYTYLNDRRDPLSQKKYETVFYETEYLGKPLTELK